MAVKVKAKETGDEMNVAAMLQKFQKDKGESIGSFGGRFIECTRLPTGLFTFDMAIGGGIPKGCCTIIYGPESSCKTNIAMKAVAANQRMFPNETNVWVAIEPFDKAWAKKMGVDVDKLVVVYPGYGEEAVDMVESFLNASDCGVVVVDSLAALITTAEAEKSAEGNDPGGMARVCSKMVKKTTHALREAEKEKRTPTLIYINQTRFKIGVMYGNPETMPGGQAPKFQAQLWIRVHGKNIVDSKVAENIPCIKEVSFTVKKNKVPIIADNGVVSMVVLPHKGLKIGETDDYNTISEMLKNWGMFEKLPKNKGWQIMDEDYPTIKAFQDRLYSNKAWGQEVRNSIITKVMKDREDMLIIQENPSIDADGVISEPEPGEEESAAG